MERHGVGALGRNRGPAGRLVQPRHLEAALPHRGASRGRHDDRDHRRLTSSPPGGTMRTLSTVLTVILPAALAAQQRDTLRPFISVDSPVVAITNVTLIDGTGAEAQTGSTVVIQRGRIAAMGARAQVPAGAQ